MARGANGTVCFEGGIHWFVCSILRDATDKTALKTMILFFFQLPEKITYLGFVSNYLRISSINSDVKY